MQEKAFICVKYSREVKECKDRVQTFEFGSEEVISDIGVGSFHATQGTGDVLHRVKRGAARVDSQDAISTQHAPSVWRTVQASIRRETGQ